MSHRANAPGIIFGIVFGLFLVGASPGAAAPRDGPPLRVEVSSLEELRQALERATPGSVIRLASGTYQIFAEDPSFTIKGVQGLPDQPITIQGTRGTAETARPTIIDGGRRLDPTMALVERFRNPGGRSSEVEDLITQNQFRTVQAINCPLFEEAAYLVIEELTVRNCWPTSFVFVSSQYVTLRAITIVGSTYPFGVDRRSDHFLVEDSVWTQDDSGYAEDESGYSGRVDLVPKPGRMWDTVPWGVAHHGSRAYLNGGLIGSLGTPGSIIVRHNIIRNAYNGVRIRANRCELPPCNVNVEIYDNDFQFVRDNPVEPEDEATNWWVFHNRIYNAHGWFSLDGSAEVPSTFSEMSGCLTTSRRDAASRGTGRATKPFRRRATRRPPRTNAAGAGRERSSSSARGRSSSRSPFTLSTTVGMCARLLSTEGLRNFAPGTTRPCSASPMSPRRECASPNSTRRRAASSSYRPLCGKVALARCGPAGAALGGFGTW